MIYNRPTKKGKDTTVNKSLQSDRSRSHTSHLKGFLRIQRKTEPATHQADTWVQQEITKKHIKNLISSLYSNLNPMLK